jgi:hypothetical protein
VLSPCPCKSLCVSLVATAVHIVLVVLFQLCMFPAGMHVEVCEVLISSVVRIFEQHVQSDHVVCSCLWFKNVILMIAFPDTCQTPPYQVINVFNSLVHS